MIRWVSIQSLIGGQMLGAEQAFGCPPIFTIDYKDVAPGNSSAYIYYQNNIKGNNIRQLVLDDVKTSMTMNFESSEDEDFFIKNCYDIDVVSAVPICSGLSQANSVHDEHETSRGANAIQNANMLGIAKFALERIKPKAYIFENAPGLYTKLGEPLRKKFSEMAEQYGYSLTFVKTNTYLHGIPQSRQRTFGIFWKSEFAPKLNKIKRDCPTVSKYLSTISKDASFNTDSLVSDFTNSCWYKFLYEKYGSEWRARFTNKAIFELCETEDDWNNLLKYADEKQAKFINHVKYKLSLGKNYMDGMSVFLKDDSKITTVFHRAMKTLIHPVEDRGFTIREYMKFMGMPDDFEWPSMKENYIWLSQNVPVTTARDWHSEVKDFLEGKLQFTNEKVVMFDNTEDKKKSSSKILF